MNKNTDSDEHQFLFREPEQACIEMLEKCTDQKLMAPFIDGVVQETFEIALVKLDLSRVTKALSDARERNNQVDSLLPLGALKNS